MKYEELKELDRNKAIKMVTDEEVEINTFVSNQFPYYSDVIIFGGHFWRTNELIAKFIDEYVQPKKEEDISDFLQEIAHRISTDPTLSNKDLIKNVNIDYSIIFDQYNRLIRNSPNKLIDWAEGNGTFFWFEHILPKRRDAQFQKIKKELDQAKLDKISSRIKNIYKFSEKEILYLQYFCSQVKCDELDVSLNTFLYLWSKEKRTGKTTISEYICSFLNGETTRNVKPHKSDLKTELQLDKFSKPKAITSRCTFMDEGGFFDMSKTYDKLKEIITSNSCEIEYKFKNSKRVKNCYRNYIISSNHDPIYFVKDEDERRMLSIHFNLPEQMSFPELEKIWKEFVLECNLPVEQLYEIYNNLIMPNSQAGESQYIKLELLDLLTFEKINNFIEDSHFSLTNIMNLPEIVKQKEIFTRKLVKEVLISLYGEPDTKQRFFKSKRVHYDLTDIQDDKYDIQYDKPELPF